MREKIVGLAFALSLFSGREVYAHPHMPKDDQTHTFMDHIRNVDYTRGITYAIGGSLISLGSVGLKRKYMSKNLGEKAK